MTKTLGAIALTAGLTGALIIGVMGDGKAGLRIVKLPGTCPALSTDSRAPARCINTRQMNGFCLCWTRQAIDQVDDEIKPEDVPAKDQIDLIVCSSDWSVSCVSAGDSIPVDCERIVTNLLFCGYSSSSFDGFDLDKITASAAPCVATGDDWGPWPRCRHSAAPRSCEVICGVGP